MATPLGPRVRSSQGRSCLFQGQTRWLLCLVSIGPRRSQLSEGQSHGENLEGHLCRGYKGTCLSNWKEKSHLREATNHREEWVKPFSFLGILQEIIPGDRASQCPCPGLDKQNECDASSLLKPRLPEGPGPPRSGAQQISKWLHLFLFLWVILIKKLTLTLCKDS